MSKLLTALAVAAVAAAVFISPDASAGPVWQASLTSADAGSTQTVTLTPRRCYCVQAPQSQTCIALGTSATMAADCSIDFNLPSPTSQPTGESLAQLYRSKAYCFDSAGATSIVARQSDAGTVNVQLFRLDTNPASTSGCNAP